jgi:hypothetical protein
MSYGAAFVKEKNRRRVVNLSAGEASDWHGKQETVLGLNADDAALR